MLSFNFVFSFSVILPFQLLRHAIQISFVLGYFFILLFCSVYMYEKSVQHVPGFQLESRMHTGLVAWLSTYLLWCLPHMIIMFTINLMSGDNKDGN